MSIRASDIFLGNCLVIWIVTGMDLNHQSPFFYFPQFQLTAACGVWPTTSSWTWQWQTSWWPPSTASSPSSTWETGSGEMTIKIHIIRLSNNYFFPDIIENIISFIWHLKKKAFYNLYFNMTDYLFLGTGIMESSTAPWTSSSACARCPPRCSPCWPSHWTGGEPSCPRYIRGEQLFKTFKFKTSLSLRHFIAWCEAGV